MNEFASFLITFRETLEMALIVGIILAYLVKIKKPEYHKTVYVGVGAGIIASVITAIAFNSIAGGFTGAAEQFFEAVTMLFGAFLITVMIVWLMRWRNVANNLRQKVKEEVSREHRIGLFLLVFFSIFREGVETVIFLGTTGFTAGSYSLIGSVGGIALAVFLGFLLFVEMVKIDLRKVFLATSILLVFFAAGLVAHSVHEFQEAKALAIGTEEAWNINPPVNPDGTYPLLHEGGAIGSIAKGLFGYNGNPSLLEVLSYAAYLGIIGAIIIFNTKIKPKGSKIPAENRIGK